MMRKLRLVIICVMMVALIGIPSGVSYADNDDFSMAYDFDPDVVGSKGGDVKLLLSVVNNGASDITWIDLAINTTTPYFQRLEGTLRPGNIKRMQLTIPFESSDLNKDRYIQVAINNDVDTNNDGVKMEKFIIQGTDDIFQVDARREPHSGSYRVGDTVRVYHDFTNLMVSDPATDVITTTYLFKDSDRLSDNISVYHGAVAEGATTPDYFDYTFTDADVGHVEAYYRIQYMMLGREYVEEVSSMAFDVESAYEIDFDVNLTASETEILAGDTVTFFVYIENHGSDMERFEIRNAEGGVMANTESMVSGSSGALPLSVSIHESCDVSYVVIGYVGSEHASLETNIVHITVQEPTPMTTDTPIPTITEAAVITAQPDIQPTDEVVATNETQEEPKSEEGKDIKLLITLFIVLTVVLAGLVVVLILIRKHKS